MTKPDLMLCMAAAACLFMVRGSAMYLLRYWHWWRARKALERLQTLMQSSGPETSYKLAIVQQALLERKPRLFPVLRANINALRALAILLPVAIKTVLLWNHELTWTFVASRYPAEWKRACAICPKYETVRQREGVKEIA